MKPRILAITSEYARLRLGDRTIIIDLDDLDRVVHQDLIQCGEWAYYLEIDGEIISLHHVLAAAIRGDMVVFRDGDKSNYCKSNLQIVPR
jgi:hypothetical protein